MGKLRIAVMVSGGGTNLQSILDACAGGKIGAEVAVVICNLPHAYALERARLAGVPGVCVPAGKRSGSPEWEAADTEHLRVLEQYGVELICMAGYMRRLGPQVYEAYRGRVLNIHPALLPSFVGAHGQRDAVEYGVRVSGCTVHFADEQFDTGPVIIQAAGAGTPGGHGREPGGANPPAGAPYLPAGNPVVRPGEATSGGTAGGRGERSPADDAGGDRESGGGVGVERGCGLERPRHARGRDRVRRQS